MGWGIGFSSLSSPAHVLLTVNWSILEPSDLLIHPGSGMALGTLCLCVPAQKEWNDVMEMSLSSHRSPEGNEPNC